MPAKKEEYYVTHSRLVRYKRIDILIDACKQAKKKLVVIGDGPDYKRLKQYAAGSKDIQFTGYVSHAEKRDLLQKATGFLFAAEEDFGIAPVEAMASGLPVLAYGKGGVLETVSPDTGLFYENQSSESVGGKLKEFDRFIGQVKPHALYTQAANFSKENFTTNYLKQVTGCVEDFNDSGAPKLV
jgi:glycosyltransferase involved in cell wall biosynthesis